jgi:hypothetical protein
MRLRRRTDMLTENELQRIGRLVRLAPYMDQEMRAKFLKLIRDLKVAEGQGIMPESAISDMAKAVPDQLVREIVADLRSGPAVPGSIVPTPRESEPVKRGSGWIEPKNEDRTRQFAVLDEIVAALAGGPNSPVK